MLFKKDFTKITEKETRFLADFDAKDSYSSNDLEYFPNDLFMYRSVFPNFNLDTYDFKDSLYEKKLDQYLNKTKRKKTNEREIVKFIKENRLYFIVGSILSNFNFGHHGAYLFPEFPLGNEFVCDYLLIGENSHGYHFVFVEFESIHQKIAKKDGDLGESVRKGIKQVNDWKFWNDSNFLNLRNYFNKHLSPHFTSLPKEFINYDSTRFHYVVVAGKRYQYKEYTRYMQRSLIRNQSIFLYHYDNLYDWSKKVIEYGNYS